MEKAKKTLELTITEEESNFLSHLAFPAHPIGTGFSFYESFALKGIRVDRVEPGRVVCTFKVPHRLTDKSGKLANGAIANLVDEVGGAVVHVEGLPMSVSVDMSIAFLASANVNDELEISSKVLGQRGGYSGTLVLIRNKATGEVIAEGRHSLFGLLLSEDGAEWRRRPENQHGKDDQTSFYENFAMRGIRVERAEPGMVVCTFKVPPRLTDSAGNLAHGAIANMVDMVGSYVTSTGGPIRNVSTDMFISFVSTAKIDDEIEVTSKRLGQRGNYTGILVLVRNKATGDVIAEGRHSMFRIGTLSKL